jgi:acid phosphatase type 7
VGCRDEEKPTPPPGSPVAESLLPNSGVVVGVGDIAVCGASGDEATAAIADSILRVDSTALLPPIVITFGDNAYPSGDRGVEDDFPRCFAKSWGKPRIMNVIRPSPGNHDYDSGSGDPYFKYFGDKAGPPGRGYYSFDFSGWHLVSLNSELASGSDREQIKAQEDWLREDLDLNSTQCTLAYFHRPLFSSGPHGSSPQLQPLWEILYKAGVDLILSGHDHHYERFKPQNPSGDYDPRNGIEEIIAGTGGGSLTGARDPLAKNSDAHVNGRYGVLKLMLGAGEYSHAFIDTNGRVWDPGTRRCH